MTQHPNKAIIDQWTADTSRELQRESDAVVCEKVPQDWVFPVEIPHPANACLWCADAIRNNKGEAMTNQMTDHDREGMLILARAENAQLASELAKVTAQRDMLVTSIIKVRAALESANTSVGITDTVWMVEGNETLFDHIDALIESTKEKL